MDNFAKSLWIVEQLYRHGDMDFVTLAERWEASNLYDGRALSNSTFRRRKDEIAQRMNIEIVYDAARRVYTIENSAEIDHNAIYQYLLGIFHLSSLSSLAQKHRQKVDLQVAPTGVELLHTLLEAIDRGLSVVFDYRSYYAPSDKVYHFEVIPCFVKLFEGRWYLVAQYLDRSQVRVLALERMSGLHIGATACKACDEVNAAEYYTHCYGIVRDDQSPEIIRLRVFAPQDSYLLAQPLHTSQRVVERVSADVSGSGEDYTIFEYFLRPSFDFTQKLLWNGDKVEVLSPKSYRQHIKDTINNLKNRYL